MARVVVTLAAGSVHCHGGLCMVVLLSGLRHNWAGKRDPGLGRSPCLTCQRGGYLFSPYLTLEKNVSLVYKKRHSCS